MLESVWEVLKKLNPFGVDESKPFNKAVGHYTKVRYCLDNEVEAKYHIGQTIRHCQLAIHRNRYDGGAHVLLANGYALAATWGAAEGYRFCMQCAVAVILEWKTNTMFTRRKNAANGRKMYRDIEDGTQGDLARLRGEAFPSMAEMHRQYHEEAIDRDSLSEVARFLVPSNSALTEWSRGGNS